MTADPSVLEGLDPFDLLDVEAARLDAHFAALDGPAWRQPTACEGWDQRELLAHLAASEAYNQACMADAVPAFLEAMAARGITDLDSFNAAGVSDRAARTGPELLAEWQQGCGATRQWLRAHAGGELSTTVGPYPVDWQAFHLANELAIHADDAGAPVGPGDAAARTAWLARVAAFLVSELDRDVTVAPVGGGWEVRAGDLAATLTAAELVAAVNGRQRAGSGIDPRLAAALHAGG